MDNISSWCTPVINSLNVNRVYSRVVSTTLPVNDNDSLEIELKLLPCADIILSEPLTVTFNVQKDFPQSVPHIVVGSVDVFHNLDIKLVGNEVLIPWLEKTQYPLSVWLFAIRLALHNTDFHPWFTPVTLQPSFAIRNTGGVHQVLTGGSAGIKGRRAYMEDICFMFPSINVSGRFCISLYGVLDGHGGDECAKFVAEELPTNVVSILRSGVDCAEGLYQAYIRTDDEFCQSTMSKAGCTSTVMLWNWSTGMAYVANSGDTRAVVSRLRTAIDITRDMKATDPIEVSRIAKDGGFVSNGRVLGSLAISRAIGDKQLKDTNSKAVICNPEVTTFQFQNDDEFVLMATDGLWDVMSSQQAVDMVHEKLSECNLQLNSGSDFNEKRCQTELDRISVELANYACDTLNSSDNISVSIIFVRHMSSGHRTSGEYVRETFVSHVPASASRSESSSNRIAKEIDEKPNADAKVDCDDDDEIMKFLMDDSNF